MRRFGAYSLSDALLRFALLGLLHRAIGTPLPVVGPWAPRSGLPRWAAAAIS